MIRVLAASGGEGVHWSDLGEVVVLGLVAGVVLSALFAITIRAYALETVARREGRRGSALAHGVLAVGTSLVLIAAVIGALITMLHR